jgi:hypothetical protein
MNASTGRRRARINHEKHQPHAHHYNLGWGWNMGRIGRAPRSLDFTGGIPVVLGSSFRSGLGLEQNTQQEVKLGHYLGVRAKMAQETMIKSSKTPYTIVRSTQFFEFVGSLAQNATEGATVRLPSVLMQPIESDGSVPSRCRPGKPIRRHSGHFRGPTNSMKLPSGSMSLDCVHGRRI